MNTSPALTVFTDGAEAKTSAADRVSWVTSNDGLPVFQSSTLAKLAWIFVQSRTPLNHAEGLNQATGVKEELRANFLSLYVCPGASRMRVSIGAQWPRPSGSSVLS